MTNMTPFEQHILEKFDELYGSFVLCEPINKKDHDRLQSFILLILREQREEIINTIIPDSFLEELNTEPETKGEK